MINSVNLIDKNHVFKDVSSRTSSDNYWLSNEEYQPDSYIKTVEKKSKKAISRIIGESVIALVIVAGSSALFMFQGGPKAFAKMLRKLSFYMDKQMQRTKLQNENISYAQAAIKSIADRIGGSFESINNFNTIKDYSLQELLLGKNGQKNGVLASVHKNITEFFRKVAQRTVLSSYKSAGDKLSKAINSQVPKSDLSKTFEINGVVKTKAEWLSEAAQKNKELQELFNINFTGVSINRRCSEYMQRANKAINEYFKDKGFFWFWSKNTLNSFVAESAVGSERLNHKHLVKGYRNAITNSYSDMSRRASEFILDITAGLSYKDKSNIQRLVAIEKSFKKLSAISNTEQIKFIKDDILKQISEFEAALSHSQSIDTGIISGIANLREMLGSFKQGKIEDILQIYSKVLPADEYKTVAKSYKKAAASLNNAVNIETEDYTGKIRDLMVGSAPTDIISILGGFATLGYFLFKAEDRDQRISVALKQGIPALTAILTSVYSNAKLFAGSKSLLLGAVSWFITGRITKYVSDHFIGTPEDKKDDDLL